MNLAIEHLNNKTDGWWDDIWINLGPADQFKITYGKDFCGNNGATSDEAVNLLQDPSKVVGVIGAVCADSTKIIQVRRKKKHKYN
ncbi:hypothetical protein HK096_008064 [Nowakowskiella sp. JEL0078]|nr:hypothetical protein HK096_008064 [Nowakowskiella sp. JEL0078]